MNEDSFGKCQMKSSIKNMFFPHRSENDYENKGSIVRRKVRSKTCFSHSGENDARLFQQRGDEKEDCRHLGKDPGGSPSLSTWSQYTQEIFQCWTPDNQSKYGHQQYGQHLMIRHHQYSIFRCSFFCWQTTTIWETAWTRRRQRGKRAVSSKTAEEKHPKGRLQDKFYLRNQCVPKKPGLVRRRNWEIGWRRSVVTWGTGWLRRSKKERLTDALCKFDKHIFGVAC